MRVFIFLILSVVFLFSFNFSFAKEFNCIPKDADGSLVQQTWKLDTNTKTLTNSKVLLNDGREFDESQLRNNIYSVFEESPTQIKSFLDHPEVGRVEYHFNLETMDLINLFTGQIVSCTEAMSETRSSESNSFADFEDAPLISLNCSFDVVTNYYSMKFSLDGDTLIWDNERINYSENNTSRTDLISSYGFTLTEKKPNENVFLIKYFMSSSGNADEYYVNFDDRSSMVKLNGMKYEGVCF